MNTVRMLIARLALVALCLSLLHTGEPRVFARAVPQEGDPVLVIGGFNAEVDIIEELRSTLAGRGFTTFSMVLPGVPSGTAPISESAAAVARTVTDIRQHTGAERVDLVAHSMGGLAQRHYVKFLGGLDSIGTYIEFGTPVNGESMAQLCSPLWPGCRDLVPGSPFLRQLNNPPAVPPGLPAYHLYSEDAGAERDPLPGAVNASVQQFCPGRHVTHRDEPRDAAFQDLIDSALRGRALTTTCPDHR